jgi:XTP/dITP diphosphohydrolase
MKTEDYSRAPELLKRLLDIMVELRDKCPWDKKQTFDTLRKLTIEETYELADAVIRKDMDGIKGELGDLMLHIVFYARVAEQQGSFGMEDVLQTIIDKLIRRHPHIYSNTHVSDEEDVKRNWEEIKKTEGRKSVLEGVPVSLPATVKANRIQEKVRGVGFDWDKKEQIWDKVHKDLEDEAMKPDNYQKTEMEFGDLFFSLINAARLYDIDPETALEKTNRKFMHRFRYLEEKTISQGRSLHHMTLDEMNEIWEEAKKYDNNNAL